MPLLFLPALALNAGSIGNHLDSMQETPGNRSRCKSHINYLVNSTQIGFLFETDQGFVATSVNQALIMPNVTADQFSKKNNQGSKIIMRYHH